MESLAALLAYRDCLRSAVPARVLIRLRGGWRTCATFTAPPRAPSTPSLLNSVIPANLVLDFASVLPTECASGVIVVACERLGVYMFCRWMLGGMLKVVAVAMKCLSCMCMLDCTGRSVAHWVSSSSVSRRLAFFGRSAFSAVLCNVLPLTLPPVVRAHLSCSDVLISGVSAGMNRSEHNFHAHAKLNNIWIVSSCSTYIGPSGPAASVYVSCICDAWHCKPRLV